jgi:hypothetical protein
MSKGLVRRQLQVLQMDIENLPSMLLLLDQYHQTSISLAYSDMNLLKLETYLASLNLR